MSIHPQCHLPKQGKKMSGIHIESITDTLFYSAAISNRLQRISTSSTANMKPVPVGFLNAFKDLSFALDASPRGTAHRKYGHTWIDGRFCHEVQA